MDRCSMRLAGAAFLIVLILMATEMRATMAVQAKQNPRTCESQSSKFKGLCVTGSNCAITCKTEGFFGGRCRDFIRKCYCTKHC